MCLFQNAKWLATSIGHQIVCAFFLCIAGNLVHAALPMDLNYAGIQWRYFNSDPNNTHWSGVFDDPESACAAFIQESFPPTYGFSRILPNANPRIKICRAVFLANGRETGAGGLDAFCSSGKVTQVDAQGVYSETALPSCGTCRSNSVYASGPNSNFLNDTCLCNAGFREDKAVNACLPVEIPICRAAGASTPHPILPVTGEKYRNDTDWTDQGPMPLSFVRTYRSIWGGDASRSTRSLGRVWAHNYQIDLQASPFAAPNVARISFGGGSVRVFKKANGIWEATDSADTLSQPADGSWIFQQSETDETLLFDAAGKLTAINAQSGQSTRLNYHATGELMTVTNPFGRTLQFAYDAGGRLSRVTLPDARTLQFGYDSVGLLSSVKFPDGKSRSFVYENPSFPEALTGILDESGVRFATFAFDGVGRAVSSELAGGAQKFGVQYASPSSASIVDPLGTSRSYSYGIASGKLAVTAGSRPSGSEEPDAASRVQDTNGLVTSEKDFKGVTTVFGWDVRRRLLTSATRAAGTPQAQTVTTQWHPTLSLPLLVTEAGRTTTFTYDASGNMLSKTIADTVTGQTWRSQWSYTLQNLVATQTEPNGAVTTFDYDAVGNLIKTRDALGLERTYMHDAGNRVIAATAPNGVITTYTWDARDRLLSQVTGALQPTVFGYNPTGTLASLSLSDGKSFSFSYDPAQRLIGWSNSRGESGIYTLDAMGNRIGEQIRNGTGAIAWIAATSVNNLNRVASRTAGYNQSETLGYDPNGELISRTNGLNQSTRYGLDGLRRIASITDAANATASLAYNPLDGVVQAKDFKGVATSYARDAQDNATAETSADIGARKTEYDALGLPSRIVDALGQATTITRDAIGRPTALTFADGKVTALMYDLTPNSRGYLSRIVDRSGTTDFTRDSLGRVVAKRQSLASGLVQEVGYGYGANGLLASIAYPGGGQLTLGYDTTGRLIALAWNGTPIVGNVTWNPMGQPTGWKWTSGATSGSSAIRNYDTAGRLKLTEFSSYVYDAAGRIISLSQQLYRPGDSDPTHTTTAMGNVVSYARYDAVGRLVGFDSPGSETSFSYDSNGNRTASSKNLDGLITRRGYTVDPQSNKLAGFNQTIGATSTTVAYGYNANGDVTSDGLRTFNYDAEGRLSAVTTGATDASPTTRYAHNALGQRVFKTEPVYPPTQGDEDDPGFWQSLIAFFAKLWSPAATDAEKLGFAFMHDEDGNLISETGTGGPNSTGSTQYIYLPTANGAMPIAAVINGTLYRVSSDHLNTPRRISNSQGQVVWQWAYSAFGDNAPTIAKNRFADLSVTPNPGTTGIAAVEFNVGYMGMYRDKESGLAQNWNRYYDDRIGRYVQPDVIGLVGGWNRFPYANLNPLMFMDPTGLDPWGREQWTPARAYTDMAGGTTTYFDPMTRDLLEFPSRNAIARGSKPGAGEPYNGEFTYCEYPNSKEFGTAKWRTTDGRSRWIHGGGSALGSRALDPKQGWVPTFGCTRAQNADVDTLCSKSEAWKKANPGQSIPYSRW